MTVITEPTTTIDDCRWAITDYQSALPRARQPLADQLDARLAQAIGERHRAEMRLEKRWEWCDLNTGHPLYDERETACIDSIAEYTEWCDVVRDMCAALGLSGERCA